MVMASIAFAFLRDKSPEGKGKSNLDSDTHDSPDDSLGLVIFDKV
jgi:hypothetical protein